MEDLTTHLTDEIKRAYKEISIIYQGTNISNEPFLNQYSKFVINNLFEKKHNILISLHNGSPLYDVIMLVCSTLAIICMSNIVPEDIANKLNKGDVVLYGGKQKRVEFVGKADIPGYFEFKQKRGTLKISVNCFSTVIPYYGNAKTLGSLGAGEQHSSLEFQKIVLNKAPELATSFVNTSVIIVSDRSYFGNLLNNIIIRFKDVEYKITDLIGISFFTEENEIQYSGNPSHLEANIKVTNTMSKARDMVLKYEENEIIGFCAFGLKGIKNTVGELEDALKRKKIAFSTINYDIGDDVKCLFGLLKDETLPSPKVYACTKDFLLSHYLGVENTKGVFKEFDEACNHIIDKQIEYKVVQNGVVWAELIKVYNFLREMRLVSGGEEHTEKFIIEAYGLLRLMISTIVPLKEFEDKNGIDVDYVTPREKLDSLKEFIPTSENISKYVNGILPYIEKTYSQLFDSNPKADHLSKVIKRGNRTGIVVDKAYYRPIIERYYSKRGLANAFSVYTVSKAKEYICDELYIVSKQDVGNILNWNTSMIQKYVLYDAEYKLFTWSRKEYRDKISFFNRCSYFDVDEEIDFCEEMNDTTEDVENVVSEIEEIETLEREFLIQNAILHSSHFAGETNSIPAEITRIAIFESGESIYLTKYYKAFVLDINRKIVKEVETKDLKNEDSLIFTINNGETKDIAELVLSRYAINSQNEALIQAIKDVENWKSHLNTIKEEKGLTYSDLSKLFKAYDYSVVAQTIRSWIDQDCHVVGPLNEDAYYAMANLFKSENMFEEFVDNPKRYIESTQLVRNQRTEILGIIADVIVSKYTGNTLNLDKSFDGIITEGIIKLSTLKRISQIKDVEMFTVPNSKANRPILM